MTGKAKVVFNPFQTRLGYNANSADPDQMLHSAASDEDQQCLFTGISMQKYTETSMARALMALYHYNFELEFEFLENFVHTCRYQYIWDNLRFLMLF